MQLWLKFSTNYLSLDSANIQTPKLFGKPHKLPLGKGMNQNWGAFFGFGDLLVLDKPIRFPSHAWSISFWMTTPVVDTGKQHTLVQSAKGHRYVVIDQTGLRLGIYDKEDHRYRPTLKLDKLSPYCWHCIIITYSKGQIKYCQMIEC